MRIGGLLGRTLRAVPSGIDPALGPAARAGFLRPSTHGWFLLPLGVRVLDRMVEALIAGLECEPAHLFLTGASDRGQVYAELIRAEVQSHRDLPLRIAMRWDGEAALDGHSKRDTVRPCVDLVAAFSSPELLDAFIRQADGGINRIADAAGVPIMTAGGVDESRCWLAKSAEGRSAVLFCETCGSAYEVASAPFARGELPSSPNLERERVHTPGASTIQALADMLGVGCERTLKALFLSSEQGELVFAVVRGDLDVSLDKLGAVVGSRQLQAATESQIIAAGAVPGFASPIGLHVRAAGDRDGVRVIADPSATRGHGFAAGANAPDYHFVHVDPRRDFSITQEADIAVPPPGARCATCGSRMAEHHGTIIARWRHLPSPSYAAEGGGTDSAAAASLTVDLLAILEQVVGACADDSGIAWPAMLAPADICVVDLKSTDAALQVSGALEARGLRVLLDDRPLSAGVKFTDADLIGCPLRLTVSPRSLQAGGGELSGRRGADPSIVPLMNIPEVATARLVALMST